MNNKFDKLEPISISLFLTNSDLAAIAQTSKKANTTQKSKTLSTLFKPILDEREIVHNLLLHVVRGKHAAVRAMLKKDINLLFQKSSVTDYSGRAFESISPFEYALWALDKHMWEVMLECIPKNQKGKKVLATLVSQYNALQIKENILEEKSEGLQTKGLTYKLRGIVITETHFDFKNTIIRELQTVIDLINIPTSSDYIIRRQWITGVGGAQSLLPVHAVKEYCSTTNFTPTPDFNSCPPEPTFCSWVSYYYYCITSKYENASTEFYRFSTNRYENWCAADSKLGSEFAVFKYNCGGINGSAVPICEDGNSYFWDIKGNPYITCDLDAMSKLYAVRSHDFINLAEQLNKQMDCSAEQRSTITHTGL